MTIDELVQLSRATRTAYIMAHQGEGGALPGAERAAMVAVVKSLRGAVIPWHVANDHRYWALELVRKEFCDILASDGVKPSAAPSMQRILDDQLQAARERFPLSTDAAAPDVCEWTPYVDEPLGSNWWRTCNGVRHRYIFDGHHPCTSCGKPIKFKEGSE